MRLPIRQFVLRFAVPTAVATFAILWLSGCESPAAPRSSATNTVPFCSGGFSPLTILVGQSSVLTCRTGDSDGDPVSWTAVQVAGSGLVDSLSRSAGSGDVSTTFTASSDGRADVLITLSDGKGFSSQGPFSVTVNVAPPRDF